MRILEDSQCFLVMESIWMLESIDVHATSLELRRRKRWKIDCFNTSSLCSIDMSEGLFRLFEYNCIICQLIQFFGSFRALQETSISCLDGSDNSLFQYLATVIFFIRSSRSQVPCSCSTNSTIYRYLSVTGVLPKKSNATRFNYYQ